MGKRVCCMNLQLQTVVYKKLSRNTDNKGAINFAKETRDPSEFHTPVFLPALRSFHFGQEKD